jgi:hypothetical protein
MNDRLYLNAEDVAARLQISKRTLYRRLKAKKFPAGIQVERTGMPGPRTTHLWDIRVVDQWAIDNGTPIRIDPTLPDREYLELVDDPAWVKNAKLVAYAIGAGQSHLFFIRGCSNMAVHKFPQTQEEMDLFLDDVFPHRIPARIPQRERAASPPRLKGRQSHS